MQRKMISKLEDFIVNRHNAYLAKEAGKPKPWTKDKIIQRYRFCNMYRELDTVTKWIATNWRDPNTDDQDVWFAMLVARYINEPATMEHIGYPVPYRSARFISVCQELQHKRERIFNPAYIIPTGGTKNVGPKHFTLDGFFTRMWLKRKEFRPQVRRYPDMGVLASYARHLTEQPGIGSFMAGQVIADLKYTKPYEGCDDWWTFAVSGPGSRRGLNRICGNDVTAGWKESDWFVTLGELRTLVNMELKGAGLSPLHGQDMQNCLCEFDKWCRVNFNEGSRPKQAYPGV